MKKIISLASIFGLFIAGQVFAVCPVCTVAVGAGIGFSRWIGIDDSVTGLWIGGLTVSMIMWTLSWFEKKNIKFKGVKILTIVGYYLIVVVPLYFMDLLANPMNAVYLNWVDKLLIGIVVGSIGFWIGAKSYNIIKEKNNGHAYFPFQKVVMPVSFLLVISFIFYFLTK